VNIALHQDEKQSEPK